MPRFNISADPASYPAIAWHSLAEPEVMRKLDASPDGLTEAQAAERRREFGPNELPARKPPSALAIFIRQFLNPLIYILLAAGAVAAAIGDVTDAVFILSVVLLNSILGTFQEWKAEQSAASLQQMLRVTARVRRDGATADIPAEDVVPGDLVFLESGTRVPADLRLLRATNLSADESLLTGESEPANKLPAVLPADLSIGDRRNIAHAGSMIETGRGMGVVLSTGLRTEVGKIARNVNQAQTAKPPLVVRMERFSQQVSWTVLAACALLGTIAFGRGMPAVDVFFLTVALAVSAIPEGLPVAITVALSIATRRMARRNVIVRKLTAVEGLGSCTLIASDKTGTLTVNRQTLRAAWLPGDGLADLAAGIGGDGQVHSARLSRFCRLAMIASETAAQRRGGSWEFSGDAVDVAFWNLGLQVGIDPGEVESVTRVDLIPFESARAYSAAFYLDNGELRVALKGAPEVVLPMCRFMDGQPFDAASLDEPIAALTGSGHRVLAVASGVLDRPAGTRTLDHRDLPPLTFEGIAGLIDPPRPEVREAVERCLAAGIEVAMITGDHPKTALAIARSVGIPANAENTVTGAELAAIGSGDVPLFLDTVKRGRIFARVSPLQKLQIVDALTRLGHFVAVTGDGVNDAPALKRANVGVAMGSGSDITKDTASIIVTDDNFASIEGGIEEGRFAYDNIRKVTYLLITTGLAEIILFALALLSGMPVPLLPVQLLWLNLATNGIQDVALAFEAGEEGALRRPPRRPDEGIFNRLMIQQMTTAGLTTALLAYVNFYILLNVMGFNEFDARNRLLLLMVLIENYHVFNCRSEYVSAFKIPLRRNWMLVWGVLGAQALHIGAMHFPPAQDVLRVAPLPWTEWLTPFAMGSVVLIAMEAFKRIKHGKAVSWPAAAAADAPG